MRLGKLALIRPGDDVDRRALGRQHHVDADGARLLGQAHDRVLDVLALAHHQVGQLVDDDDDVGHAVRRIDARLVEGPDVARGGAGQAPVAALHLVDRPVQRGLGLLGLGDDRHEQVGRPL